MLPAPLSQDPVWVASAAPTRAPIHIPPTVQTGQIHQSYTGDVKLVFDKDDFVIVAFDEKNTRRFIYGMALDEIDEIGLEIRPAFIDDARKPWPEPINPLAQLMALFKKGPGILLYFKPPPSPTGENHRSLRILDLYMKILSGEVENMPVQFQAYENQVDFDTPRPWTGFRSISVLKNPPNPEQPVMFNDVPVDAVRFFGRGSAK